MVRAPGGGPGDSDLGGEPASTPQLRSSQLGKKISREHKNYMNKVGGAKSEGQREAVKVNDLGVGKLMMVTQS